jgi:peptidase M15-like protein
MRALIRTGVLAAALAFVSGSTLLLGSQQGIANAAVASVPVAAKVVPAADPFGLDPVHDHEHASGLAPGQSPEDFEAWLASSPAHRAALTSFRDRLSAEGVEGVVPLWQLVRTSSSWRECNAEPFEAPPADKWDHIVTTLKFVRDRVEPAVGDVEALSAYRNEKLNQCSNGAPQSAHRNFFALDLTPVNKAVDRSAMIRSVCAAHARDGRAYNAGLGFYSGKRFHVDSSGYRKWGANGKGATSPCVGMSAQA